LTINGTGKWILSGANSFTGGVFLDSGTLGISGGGQLGAAPSPAATDLTFAGNSTLQFEAAIASNGFNANRSFTIDPGVSATVDTQAYTDWMANQWMGSGSVIKISSGTLGLQGTNSYTGGTTISAGVVELGNAPCGGK
jgi:autotransporter-associated beta strand protein